MISSWEIAIQNNTLTHRALIANQITPIQTKPVSTETLLCEKGLVKWKTT